MEMRTGGQQIPTEGRNVVYATDVRSRNFRSLTATSAKVGHLGGSDRPPNELKSTIKSDFPALVLKESAICKYYFRSKFSSKNVLRIDQATRRMG